MSRRTSRSPITRDDGKVEASCPQCGALFRLPPERLDQKFECVDCHRVFFPNKTVGKRVKPDHTRAYVAFAVGTLLVIGIGVAISMNSADHGSGKPKTTAAAKAGEKAKEPVYTLATHPRAQQLFQWAQGVHSNDGLVVPRHTDVVEAARRLSVADVRDTSAVLKALQTHESTRLLREMDVSSAALGTQADMTAASGWGTVYLAPNPRDPRQAKLKSIEMTVSFRMEGDTIKVIGWDVAGKPPAGR